METLKEKKNNSKGINNSQMKSQKSCKITYISQANAFKVAGIPKEKHSHNKMRGEGQEKNQYENLNQSTRTMPFKASGGSGKVRSYY